jgi:predicted RecB family nuclease
MRLVDGRAVYAASDLNDYLACPHRVALRRDAMVRGVAQPDDDPTLEIIARKGREHELRMLDVFAGSGRRVTTIPDDEGSPVRFAHAVAATRAAMERGDEVIYQGAFLHDGWSGRADFLERVESPSALGPFSYNVADTKLALRERPAFLVQLCLYAEFVAAIQGTLPGVVRAIFGDARDVPYDPARYLPYVRRAKARFAARIGALAPEDFPERIAACGQCAWSHHCESARRAVDDLSLVAWIRRDQIVKLRGNGIATLAALAAAPDDARPAGMESFAALRRQARLQLAQRSTGEYRYELLAERDDAGFALLPAPDPDDVYFDMEGDPLYDAGAGLEYLFGAVVRTAVPPYRWGWGETPDAEKQRFQEFVGWLVAHRRAHPNAHVYHYAPYERSALRRLAMRHGTREDEVDALLREQAFVDLYAVVRGAVAQSQESYSIKKLEPFYGFVRTTDVRKGDQSIVAFEDYLLGRDDGSRDERKRDDIIAYNREDCESTAELHEWLLAIRPRGIPWRTPAAAEERAARADEIERRAVEDALLASALPGPNSLVAHLLAYHRREAKPVCWAVYDRTENDVDFVVEDKEALGGLRLSDDPAHAPVAPPGKTRRTQYTYCFPPQQHKLGRKPIDPATLKPPGDVTVDDDRRLVRIKLSTKAPHPTALIPGWPIPTDNHAAALLRFGVAVRDGVAAEAYPAAWDIVCRARPRVTGLVDGSTIQPALRAGEEAIDPNAVADLALRLDHSALVVQGPPGSGKTYVGAHVVAALVAAGKRVGITSTGHKAINNFLSMLERTVAESGRTLRGVKKGDGGLDQQFDSKYGMFENRPENDAFAEYDVVAGTSWLFVHPALADVDVLVIDEAGQFALADAVAVAGKAGSVVLLGDPLQLAHVSQGSHPDGAGVAVLTHLVGEAETVAPDRGVFLDRSFRMHPALANFVSAMVYDGRLRSAESCARQRIDAPWFSGAGLRYVAVEHDGNAQASDQEAAVVADICSGLVGGTFTDHAGRTRAMTIDDVLVVSPYNAQVNLLKRTLRARFGDGARVGTVDKFQGQEAPAVIYSLGASSAEDAPRGADFLFEENRFNVAVSRGRALAVVVASPRLLEAPCATVELLRSVGAFCAFAEAAESSPPAA